MPVLRVLKGVPVMPHFHEGADNPFGLGAVDLGEFLTGALLRAGFDKGVLVGALYRYRSNRSQNLIGALRQHIIDQELGGTVLGLVRQDVGVKLPGEAVDSNNRYFRGWAGDWPLSSGRRLVSKWTSSPG